MLKHKTEIMDAQTMKRAITRIAHEIIEKNKGTNDLVIIGIQRRGIHIAQRIANRIKLEDNVEIPVGSLDIGFYKDDLSTISDNPIVKGYSINFSINNKVVILVDDVLYTGRTIRTSIDLLLELGKPSCIQLAELIDRGHRELPIRADYSGKNVPTSTDEVVNVKILEVDGCDEVIISQIKTSILM